MRWTTALLVCALATLAMTVGAQTIDDKTRREALKHARAGQELLYSEAFERAAAEFQSAIKLDPLLALAHYGLGQAYMGLKDYPRAIEVFTKCRDVYRQLAGAMASDAATVERRRDEEISELRDAVRAIQSGRVKTDSFQVMRLEERIRDLQRTKQRADAPPEAPAAVSLSLGSAYFHTGQLADAEREYLVAIKASPSFGEAHNNLAVVYLLTGRAAEAEAAVARAEAAGYRVNPQLKKDIQSRKN
jgi:tetratricopeptide (TPR) repeat protein